MSKPNAYQHIHLCKTEYEKEFPDDWIDKLDWSSSNAKKSFKLGQKKISDFHRICFIYVSQSLLGGEYIYSIKSHNRAKQVFERYWTQEHYCSRSSEDDFSFSLKENLYNQYELLDNCIKDLFYDYTSFIISINEKIEPISHKYIFKATTNPPILNTENKYFRLLKDLIFPLCYIEHHLSFSKKNLERITVLLERIKYEKSRETDERCLKVFQLAVYKGSFILKKLLRKDDSFEILIDLQKSEITRNSIMGFTPDIEKLFLYFQNIHEDQQYTENVILEDQQSIEKKNETFMQIAHLMNYYCTKGGSEDRVKNLLNYFEKKYDNIYAKKIKHNFDKYALRTLRNFMYNCQLSFILQKDECTIEELRNKIEQIENIQEETSIRNFYPYKKAIEFLIKEAKSKIVKRNTSFDYNGTIQLLDSYIKKFDKNIDWCKSHCFYPVQLLLNECIVSIDNDKLFLPSSISRPIDYEKLERDRENFRADIEYIRNSLIYIKDKIDTEIIKEELKNTEKRYLQIGGILIGVVTFLFGSINIFSQQTSTPRQLFESTMYLGIILVLFALLLVVVIEYWKREINKIRVAICGIIFVIYTILVIFTFQNDNTTKTNKIETQKSIESPIKES
jgi:uncharacterized membrane protein